MWAAHSHIYHIHHKNTWWITKHLGVKVGGPLLFSSWFLKPCILSMQVQSQIKVFNSMHILHMNYNTPEYCHQAVSPVGSSVNLSSALSCWQLGWYRMWWAHFCPPLYKVGHLIWHDVMWDTVPVIKILCKHSNNTAGWELVGKKGKPNERICIYSSDDSPSRM